MSSECILLNPLQRDGTSQEQRLADALEPSYVSVDERDLSDYLVYLYNYAQLLQYYTINNTTQGNWQAFVAQDISTLVARIAVTDYRERREAFQHRFKQVENATGEEQVDGFCGLLIESVELARLIDAWYEGSVEKMKLHRRLEEFVCGSLRGALQQLKAIVQQAEAAGLTAPDVDALRFAVTCEQASPGRTPSLFETGLNDEEIGRAARQLKRIFDVYYEALVHLVQNASTYLQETIERYPSHQPHIALLITFLQLLLQARDHLNTLTKRHLNFYYSDVLRLKYRPAAPDKVHVVFGLAQHESEHRIPKDTALKAGKDSTGRELLYATDGELVVNRARIDEEQGLKTVYINKDDHDNTVENIYAAPVANSSDGLGADIEAEDGKWETFGGTHIPKASVGFAIASPQLLLQQGTRTIKVTFTFDEIMSVLNKEAARGGAGEEGKTNADIETIQGHIEEELRDKVSIFLSGAEGWIPAAVRKVTLTETAMSYTVILPPNAPAVVPFNPEVLEDRFATTLPVWKLLMNQGDAASPYRYFHDLTVQEITIAVGVDGMSGLLLENDLGIINPSKPFQPFGPQPGKGSSFYVGSSEIFQKKLDAMRLHIKWGNLPEESFEDYYAEFNDSRTFNFAAEVSVLRQGQWETAKWNEITDPEAETDGGLERNVSDEVVNEWAESDEVPLFDDNGGLAIPAERRDIELRDLFETRAAGMVDFDAFSSSLSRGFLRIQLRQDFLHREYPRLLAEAAAPDGGAFPNEPYTPFVTSLRVGYTSCETIDFSEEAVTDGKRRIEQFFHIHPFGQAEFYPTDESLPDIVTVSRQLVPSFPVAGSEDAGTEHETAEGTLYIGLRGLEPPQNVSILFQVAEGSGDPLLAKPDVVWSCLANNRWIEFEKEAIVSDQTNGLMTSGILTLAMPKTMTAANTVLPSGLHWIKASVSEHTAAVSKLIAVIPQAVQASFRDRDNDPQHVRQGLSAGTISKLKNRRAAITAVEQPFASFGGKMREQEPEYYTRVSERLRHKQRAISIFDYERLVLEEFADVYKVQCINHTDLDSEHAPGHVKLIVVPNLRNKNAVDPLRPRVSLQILDEIQAYLDGLSSDFVTVTVKNPVYEQVQAAFSVKLEPGRDEGFYQKQLNQDIKKFLSPWLYEEGEDLPFGGSIHRSWILNFVEERTYVDYVTRFSLDHITATTTFRDVEEAEASTSSSVLISAASHRIEIIS